MMKLFSVYVHPRSGAIKAIEVDSNQVWHYGSTKTWRPSNYGPNTVRTHFDFLYRCQMELKK